MTSEAVERRPPNPASILAIASLVGVLALSLWAASAIGVRATGLVLLFGGMLPCVAIATLGSRKAPPLPRGATDVPALGMVPALVLPYSQRRQRALAVGASLGGILAMVASTDPSQIPALQFFPPIYFQSGAALTWIAFAPILLNFSQRPEFALSARGLVLKFGGIETWVPWAAIRGMSPRPKSKIFLDIDFEPGTGVVRRGVSILPGPKNRLSVPLRSTALGVAAVHDLCRFYWLHPDERVRLGRDIDSITAAIGKWSDTALTQDQPYRITER